jgi:3,4-dihydroxy 2-butanone 4-phosphate synthase
MLESPRPGRRSVKSPDAGTALAKALDALRAGHPVLLYDADGREEETDLVIASQVATMEAIRALRTEAGGLLCTTVAPEHHQKLGLPFLADLVKAGAARHPVLRHLNADDIRYDPSKSSFGLTVNHRSTYTGIPDGDRSVTIRELAGFLGELDTLPTVEAQKRFGREFRSPGHCILLNGAVGGLAARQGHTELSLELARLAGLVPSTTICEMLDPTSGKALGKKQAMAYAQAKGLVFLTGHDVMTAWQQRIQGKATQSAAVPA